MSYLGSAAGPQHGQSAQRAADDDGLHHLTKDLTVPAGVAGLRIVLTGLRADRHEFRATVVFDNVVLYAQ